MGKRGIALAAVAGLAGLGIGGTAVAEPASAGPGVDRQVVQRAAEKMAGEGGAAGVQIRVVDGRDRFTARAGVAEWGTTKPVPADGRFRAGSITKTFVATVVLQLVGEGRVGLDQPVGRYLPGLLPDGDEITVRMVLQHTSGLYNYTASLPLDPAGFETIRYQRWTPQEILAIATSKPLDFPPGTAFNYSNTNYAVAALLVEKITGKPYENAVSQRILRPLGLRATSLPGHRLDIPGPHAHGYYSVAGEVVDVTRLNPSVAYGSGELISSTADLDRFIDALLDGRLLKPAQQAELHKALPFSRGYGLGLEQNVLPCGVTVYGHGGGIPGYSSFMGSTKDTKTRLQASFTQSPEEGNGQGWDEVLTEVFC
ncbi:serine hydrolase domain-containing protein [Actinosynnema sp. NPDC047251]|uniref:Serine-type D-Ala-D-Ala carboxypeptidase n=1 Tax=Saccharothrix espanaensis (strain ATCC 51144 / DSM 44229 / JCM 9112 / NBRC 15066 / NRRL 15764) TaxID=1179773 RepID=K0KDR7_SACES|nr:serine hydrolase domain-containing protein [Saccharothrix espanaensis]CCH34668.1 Serine-type D-Ala-D-Ala carboxypeptidase [Saccharothrix espanaensis DSM 44229]